LKEGDQVVTGMSQPGAAAQAATSSPLIPFGRRGGANGNRGGGAAAPAGARGGAGQ
jgi:hypothetical protein